MIFFRRFMSEKNTPAAAVEGSSPLSRRSGQPLLRHPPDGRIGVVVGGDVTDGAPCEVEGFLADDERLVRGRADDEADVVVPVLWVGAAGGDPVAVEIGRAS